jgi:hypothetical protein
MRDMRGHKEMNLKRNEWQFIILLIKFHYMADNEQVLKHSTYNRGIN